MSIVDIDGNPMEPTGFREFADIYNQLLAHEREPQSPREKILAQSIDAVQQTLNDMESPLDVLTLCFWSWIAVYGWTQAQLNEIGLKQANKLDALLRQLCVQLTFDAWEAMSEIKEEDLNGEANPNAISSEAPISLVP